MMWEWPFVFASGLLGAAHCLGMCGPLVITLGSRARSARENFSWQILYTLGRLTAYGLLGAIAGFVGYRLNRWLPASVHIAAWLSIIAGLFLAYQGLLATGLIRPRGTTASGVSCFARGPLAGLHHRVLRAGGRTAALLAGMLTAMLPCGLLYGMIGLAASSRHMTSGLVTMLLFGAGTAVPLVITGLSASLLGQRARHYLWRLAAWSLLVTGLLAMSRGVAFLSYGGGTAPCPFCS